MQQQQTHNMCTHCSEVNMYPITFLERERPAPTKQAIVTAEEEELTCCHQQPCSPAVWVQPVNSVIG